jgi:hypothetical protein
LLSVTETLVTGLGAVAQVVLVNETLIVDELPLALTASIVYVCNQSDTQVNIYEVPDISEATIAAHSLIV